MRQNRHLQNRDDFVSELGNIVIEDLLYRKSKVDSQALNPTSKWESVSAPADGTAEAPTADIPSAVGYRYGLIKGQIFALDAYNDGGLHPRYDRFHNQIRASQLITAGQMMDYVQNNYNGVIGDRKVYALPAGASNVWVRPGSQIQGIIDSGSTGAWATKYLSEGASVTDSLSRLSFFTAVNAKEHKIGEENDWVAMAGREDPYYKTGYHRDSTFRYFDGGDNHRLFFAIRKDTGLTEHAHLAISEAVSEVTSPVSKVFNGNASFKNSVTIGNFLSHLSSTDSTIRRYGEWLVNGYDADHPGSLFAENFAKTYMSSKDIIQEVSGPPLFRKGTGTVTLNYGDQDIYGVGTNFQTVFGSASFGDRKTIRINDYDFEVVDVDGELHIQVAVAPSLFEEQGQTTITDLDWYYLSADSIIPGDFETVDVNSRFFNGKFDAQTVDRTLKFFRSGIETLPRVEIGLDYHKYSSGVAESRGFVRADHVICRNFTWTNPDLSMQPATGGAGRFEIFGNFIALEVVGEFGAIIQDCGNIVARRSLMCNTNSVADALIGGRNGLIVNRGFVDLYSGSGTDQDANFFAFHNPTRCVNPITSDLIMTRSNDDYFRKDLYAIMFTEKADSELGIKTQLGALPLFRPSMFDADEDQIDHTVDPGITPKVAFWIGNDNDTVAKSSGLWLFTDKLNMSSVIADKITSRVVTRTNGIVIGKGRHTVASGLMSPGLAGSLVIPISGVTPSYNSFGTNSALPGYLYFGGALNNNTGSVTPNYKMRAMLSSQETYDKEGAGWLKCKRSEVISAGPYQDQSNNIKSLFWLHGSDGDPNDPAVNPGNIFTVSNVGGSLKSRIRTQEILIYSGVAPWGVRGVISDTGTVLPATEWKDLTGFGEDLALTYQKASIVTEAGTTELPLTHKALNIDTVNVDVMAAAIKDRPGVAEYTNDTAFPSRKRGILLNNPLAFGLRTSAGVLGDIQGGTVINEIVKIKNTIDLAPSRNFVAKRQVAVIVPGHIATAQYITLLTLDVVNYSYYLDLKLTKLNGNTTDSTDRILCSFNALGALPIGFAGGDSHDFFQVPSIAGHPYIVIAGSDMRLYGHVHATPSNYLVTGEILEIPVK